MKIIDADSKSAKDHPLLRAFVGLVEQTVGQGVLDFTDLQSRPFMKFWQNLVIHRFDSASDDFRNIFWGTQIGLMFGQDCTGKLLSEMGYGEAYDTIRDLDMQIINGERRIYASGTLFWQGREQRQWHQVKMPLQRNGRINEVLFCADIS